MLDRFVGCLLGLACGDALGAPVEEWSRETIRGSLGFVRDYQTTILGRGIITDDTQMAIILSESIIQNEHFDPSHFAYLLGDWQKRIDEGKEPARGAGQTVSLAGRRLYKGTYWKRSGEFSAGNSAAVRVPPLALYHCRRSVDVLVKDAESSAIPTHIDPLAIAGTQAFALAIHCLLQMDYESFDPRDCAGQIVTKVREINHQVADAMADVWTKVEGRELEEAAFLVPGGPQEITYFDRSMYLEGDIRTLTRMGTGKFILQSLAAAMYCFLAHPKDPESAILCAVNAGGDTDTIAAMAGALAGALGGAEGIPSRWLGELEKKDYRIELANMLYDLATEGKTTREFGGWRIVM
jgi:ADP-ribosylglycohydrolase